MIETNTLYPESFEAVLGRSKLDGETESYQQEAVRGLLRETKYVMGLTPNDVAMRNKNMKHGHAKEVLLKAPTGSGKTIMCGAYIDILFKDMDKVIVLWLSETPNLTRQSLDKFEAIFDIKSEFFEGLRQLELTGNHVIGVNWEKIKNKRIRNDGEQFDSIDTHLAKAKSEGYKIITIIDEAHSHADSKLSKEFLAVADSNVVVHVTATPIRDYGNSVFVDAGRVQQAGFIKQGVVINDLKDAYDEDYRNKTGVQNITQYFLKQSIDKRNEIEETVKAYAEETDRKPFVPLLVIQMPNNSKDLMDNVEHYLDSEGYSRLNGNLAVYMSNDYTDELDTISNDEDVKILLFKQAISKGWDCPRASMITLLREPNRHHFVTQTIGRILRNPYLEIYPKDYDNLNFGYVYIEETENQVLQQVVEGIQGDDIPLTLLRKPELETELDLLKTARIARSKFNIKDKANEVINLVKREINQNNWLDNLDTDTQYTRSIASHTISAVDIVEQTDIDLTESDGASYTLSNLDLTLALDRYADRVRMNKDILWKILQDIVQPKLKGGTLSSTEILNIVFSNEDAFTLMLKRISDEIEKTHESSVTDIFEEWEIPSKWVVNRNAEKLPTLKTDIYPYDEIWMQDNNLERSFARMLDANTSVKLWYKNGDNGDKYFSLVYELKGKLHSFYPDFLVETDDTLYILETKGQLDSDENIQKVDALIRYKSNFDQTRDYDKQRKNLVAGYVKTYNDQFYIYTGTNFKDEMKTMTNWTLLAIQ